MALTGTLLLGALAGCPTAPSDPAIAIGTGQIGAGDGPNGEDFVPLTDGDTLLVTQGPQGCCHVNGSLRVAGVEPGDPDDLAQPRNPTMAFDLLFEGASIVDDGDATQGLEDAPDSAAPFTHEFIERRVILDILNDDDFEGGVDGVFSVTLDDADGIHLRASVDVVLEPHPFNE